MYIAGIIVFIVFVVTSIFLSRRYGDMRGLPASPEDARYDTKITAVIIIGFILSLLVAYLWNEYRHDLFTAGILWAVCMFITFWYVSKIKT